MIIAISSLSESVFELDHAGSRGNLSRSFVSPQSFYGTL